MPELTPEEDAAALLAKVNEAPARIDLDAKRAARRAQEKAGPVVVFGGKEWQLPPELPWDLVRDAARGMSGDVDALDRILITLFGDDYRTDETFRDLGIVDVLELFEDIGPLYGLTLGNLQASS